MRTLNLIELNFVSGGACEPAELATAKSEGILFGSFYVWTSIALGGIVGGGLSAAFSSSALVGVCCGAALGGVAMNFANTFGSLKDLGLIKRPGEVVPVIEGA